MTSTTYEVRFWKIEKYMGVRKTTHYVRWVAAGTQFKKPFGTRALAESFRAKLLAAAREGVAFDTESGLPVSMLRNDNVVPWLDFACAYVDMKWPTASPNHRRSIADALIPITIAMLKGQPADLTPAGEVRRTLRLAFNVNTRPTVADEVRRLSRTSHATRELAKPEALRALLGSLDRKLDGSRAAPDTVRLRRIILANALDFAVERKLLDTNPLTAIKVSKGKSTIHEVDRRSVVNPIQARTLLAAVADIADRLAAFFALMYFAALRPEEAVNLRVSNLAIPEEGWGEIHLASAAPEVAGEWTDSRTRNEERALKHRDEGTGRTVPCSPELTAHLQRHMTKHGAASDGRLFPGARAGGRMSNTVYGRVWAKAREVAFIPDVVAGPLAKRPYDLRHAAVSTWLNAGVEATRVAAWAGHSVAVLLRVYAKCLDGGEQAARTKVQLAMTGG